MDRHRYITRSRRAFVRIKKANEPKARAASSLSGIRLKKVDEKNSMVAVFRSMARGLTISASQDKIHKSPSPPVDITAACSNEFSVKGLGSVARERPNLADPDKCAHERPRPLAKIRLSTWTCCPRAETEVYRLILLPGMSNAPPPCVPNRDPWLKLFSLEGLFDTNIPIPYIRGTVTG